MLASNVRYLCARRKRLLGDPRLLIVRPTSPAPEVVQNLNPHRPATLSMYLQSHRFPISQKKKAVFTERQTLIS